MCLPVEFAKRFSGIHQSTHGPEKKYELSGQ